MARSSLADCTIAEQLIHIFERANSLFLKKEADLILSGVAERTLCGSLMQYLQREIDKSVYSHYNVDVEYNRNNGEIKTIINERMEIIPINCDLIVHSRGEIIKQDNLITLEMKKSTASNEDKIKDKNRLIVLTKETYDDIWSNDGTTLPKHVCGYKLGIYYEVNIRVKQIYIEFYKQGEFQYTTKYMVNNCSNAQENGKRLCARCTKGR